MTSRNAGPILFALFVAILMHAPRTTAADEPITVHLQSRPRTPSTRGLEVRLKETREEAWAPRETALIICDMWDDHW
ncbi:MAG TPA: hypothetical protein PKW90_20770, partial [Myxococcota bacterium]|nr:hypothetical protein [Myxococcota bacterium]